MTSERLINATFKYGTCDVCGAKETNQFFKISDNFIDFNGKYLSLRCILKDSLDIHLKETLNEQEICIDCQDKVFKFYHFKHKVKEFQTKNINSNINSKAPQNRSKYKSRIIHRITDIIEDYTKTCSISSIRVEKDNKRLVIESDVESSEINDVIVKQEPLEDFAEKYWENTTNSVSDFLGISITEESTDFPNNVTDVLKDIDVKKEPSELPIIVSCSTLPTPDIRSSRGRRRNGQFGSLEEQNVSPAALKMRAYRERLKTPGNELRMLRMMQKQREWNRNYYIRKQISSGQPIRSRRRRTDLEMVEDICNRRSF